MDFFPYDRLTSLVLLVVLRTPTSLYRIHLYDYMNTIESCTTKVISNLDIAFELRQPEETDRDLM